MRKLGLALGVFLYAALPALAQQGTSEIVGKVTDTQGAVLPGVAIVVTNEDTGVYREVVTTPNGSYSVTQIVPGRYRISAQLSGSSATKRRSSRSHRPPANRRVERSLARTSASARSW